MTSRTSTRTGASRKATTRPLTASTYPTSVGDSWAADGETPKPALTTIENATTALMRFMENIGQPLVYHHRGPNGWRRRSRKAICRTTRTATVKEVGKQAVQRR